MAAVARHVLSLVEGKETSNVVSFEVTRLRVPAGRVADEVKTAVQDR